MAKQTTKWVCTECGNLQHKWSGNCDSCQKWNTFEEILHIKQEKQKFSSATTDSQPVLIKDVSLEGFERLATSFVEFNRLMGGGIVKGSLNLVGGQPGIGKSTLMLQLCHHFALSNQKVLYVCGEESAEQTSLRAKRLGVESDKIYLLSQTQYSQIKYHIDLMKPDVVVMDSAQIIYKDDIPSTPGSVVQVKEIALECMHLAKGKHMTIFLIGHVTKNGDLAGPRVLEHIVDVVLDFEGDSQHGYRMLRSTKNRFGPTDEVVVFQMQETGLSEVINPSLVFLDERRNESSGSAVVATLEGSRSILIEIQALVTKSFYPNPVRKSSGIDHNRLSLLLAVCEKKLKYPFYGSDVFVNVMGGMKVTEPGGDLGVALALISSYLNEPLDHKLIAIGEVGLSGEIRSVMKVENRIKEALHLGFETCLIPYKNFSNLPEKFGKKIKLIPVHTLDEAVALLFGSTCRR